MKNKTLLLTRNLLKNGEGFGIKGMKNKVSKVLFSLMLIIILPGLVAMFSLFVNGAYSLLTVIGQEGVIISWGIAVTSVVIFIFGIFYIAASFYFSKDVEVLLYLPLKPRQMHNIRRPGEIRRLLHLSYSMQRRMTSTIC